MADEDFQKKMEFIIEQQAQSGANHEKANERLKRLESLVARFEQATVESIEATAKRKVNLDKKFAALADAHRRTEESIKKTKENLRNLTAAVDRHLNQGHNRKPEA